MGALRKTEELEYRIKGLFIDLLQFSIGLENDQKQYFIDDLNKLEKAVNELKGE